MVRHILLIGLSGLFWLSCTVEPVSPECQQPKLFASAFASPPCQRQGAITVLDPTGPEYQYSLNYGAYQSAPTFERLTPGEYIVVVRSAQNCADTLKVMVNEPAPGPKFRAVKTLLSQNCQPCHSGSSPWGGINVTISCDIITHQERIKVRAVDGIPGPMPQGGLMPAADRKKITDWLEAGGRFSD
jgi:hypothetical protein